MTALRTTNRTPAASQPMPWTLVLWEDIPAWESSCGQLLDSHLKERRCFLWKQLWGAFCKQEGINHHRGPFWGRFASERKIFTYQINCYSWCSSKSENIWRPKIKHTKRPARHTSLANIFVWLPFFFFNKDILHKNPIFGFSVKSEDLTALGPFSH